MSDRKTGNTEPESGSQLAYTTTTGDAPKSNLAANAADKEAPVIEVATPRRIRKAVTKKRTPRVKAKAEPLHKHIQVNPLVMDSAKMIASATSGEYKHYHKLEIVDDETVIVR